MTTQETAIQTITANLVSEDSRLDFLPSFFGRYFMQGEQRLYTQARRYVKGYNGGYWNYYTLSNGGFFMALDTKHDLDFIVPDNYFSERMSTEAVGVTLTLYVLGTLFGSNIPGAEVDRFVRLYYLLRDYAKEHKESAKIMTAID